MRASLSLTLLLGIFLAGPLAAQAPTHVAVEATTMVLDETRLRRAGVAAVRVGDPAGTAVWLDLVRRERAVERESTQHLVVLSGSPAELSGQRTVVGRFGHGASAGPAIWVEPTALPSGEVRLRIWSTVGDVRPGPRGTVLQETPIEARTEIVVPSGTPVAIASVQHAERSSERGLLSRGSSSSSGQSWIVITARVVGDAAQAFPLPDGWRP